MTVLIVERKCGFVLFSLFALHDSPYFEKSLQVVNLSEGHGDEHQGFEEGPQHHSAVGVVVNYGRREKMRGEVKTYR